MSESLSDRYFALIDQIVDLTLQGKISSFERVYRMLEAAVESGTGEILERCLNQRLEATKAQLDTKLKAARVLRALETIEKQWLRWQEANQVNEDISEITQSILTVDPEDYFLAIVDVIDPNHDEPFTSDQLQKLAESLKAAANNQTDLNLAQAWQQLSIGITTGLTSFTALEGDLVSWMYTTGNNFSGFGTEKPNPWRIWAQKTSSPLPKQLFQTLAQQQPVATLAQVINNLELRALVELAILLQYIQRGLVNWFDQQPYNSKFGRELSYSTLLTFASIWCELWQVFIDSKPAIADGCFLMMLQILRSFAQRDDFPLYSGVFASFSGEYLQDTLDYFDEPLQQIEGTEEKARILTLLGYSQRTIGAYEKALIFHEEALEIAIEADDYPCE
ncbi:MAG: tetratricopeptide repeat protein, partial [Waterburya sp.]